MRTGITIIICFLLIFSASAQTDLVRSDIKFNWFKSVDGQQIPVLENISTTDILFFVPRVSSSLLEICNEQPFDVWIDNRLILAKYKEPCLFLDLDTLVTTNPSDTLYFRLESSNLKSLQTQLVYKELNEQLSILQSRNKKTSNNNFAMIFMLVILTAMAIYRNNFAIKFRRAFKNPFVFKIRGTMAEDSYGKFFSADNFYALVFLSLFISGLLIIIDSELNIFKHDHNNLPSTLWFWLLSSFSFLIFCLAKFIVSNLLAQAFNIQSIPNIQIQDFVHFMTFVSVITFVMVFIDFSFATNEVSVFLNIARLIIISAILFFQLWFYLKFVRYYSHRKLLLISYLCTTEFLPGFIASYWLVN